MIMFNVCVVIGADSSGECAMVHHQFLVDVTPPISGKIKTGPFFDMVRIYEIKLSIII